VTSTRTRRLRLLAALAAAPLVAATACGSSSGGSPSSTGGSSPGSGGSTNTARKDATIAAEVPAKIRAKGALKVAADASYAPNEFFDTDGTTIIGMDPDLGHALGTVMGLKFNFVNATFNGIITGIQSKRFDLGMSSFTDNKDREKTVDMVTYFSAGTKFMVKSDSTISITGLADLCGHSVAVESGTTQESDTKAQSTKCTKAGKKKVDVQAYDDQNGANLALTSGRAQIAMADAPVIDYQVKKSNGTFKLTGQEYGAAPYGIAVPKNSGLAKPILDALKNLIAHRVYIDIMKKWGIESGAITNPVINGAIS
jgi:polar amino acid transport system substrate-binding protein